MGALRGRTSQHNLGDLGPTHVAGAAPGVQDEVEFWLDGAARARTPRVPEPPPEGAWFWGDSEIHTVTTGCRMPRPPDR